MKLFLLATVFIYVLTGSAALGQEAKRNEALEQSIRKLELAESDAVVRSDAAALEKLWAEDFTVNNPNNQVSKGRKEVIARVREGLLNYSSFVREIETIGFYGDTVIVMGLETIVPRGASADAGKAIRRRYTNIWMKRKGQWRLSARHANVICQN